MDSEKWEMAPRSSSAAERKDWNKRVKEMMKEHNKQAKKGEEKEFLTWKTIYFGTWSII